METKGLAGVKAGNSSICFIDGNAGQLLYRGYNIHELATDSSFEEVAHLLVVGELPSAVQLDSFKQQLNQHLALPAPVLKAVCRMPEDAPPIVALRTAVSLLGMYDPEAEDNSPEATLRKASRLTGQLPALTAAYHRHRNGLEPLQPRGDLSHAANFLYLLTGNEPSETETRAMDVILVLHADHGFNASTFAARVVTGTLADLHSAVTAALGALKGPLHGGANQRVLETLMRIGSVEGVEPYVKEALAAGQKIMGFGHRVYRSEDPRAVHLRDLSRALGEQSGDPRWYEMSVEMEDVVQREKQLDCNVDFYSASVQHYLGIPADLFTCVFAASRVTGWAAHVLEQLADNRLIRPVCEYTGPKERPLVGLSAR